MKKILLILFISLFLISFVSSLDIRLPQQCCGGDEYLCIACLGDAELIFLGGELPDEGLGFGHEYFAPNYTLVEEKPVEMEKPFLEKVAVYLGISVNAVYLLISLIFIGLIWWLIILIKQREREKERKRRKEEEKKQS